MKFNSTWLNWRKVVISDPDLSFYAKGLALYLATFMNDSHDMAFPSLRRIENEMNVSRKTIIKYLGELSNTGYIQKGSILSPATQQFHNTYQALIPDSKNPIQGGGGRTPPTAEVVDLREVGGGSQGAKVVEDVHPNSQLNNQRNNQERGNGAFAPPTQEEVNAYWVEKKLSDDPEAFFDHYTSNGWKVSGKSPMKDWQASARNWSRRRNSNEANQSTNRYGQSNHARVINTLRRQIGQDDEKIY
jgi:DNA-binding transcriptional MocR family regulator